MNSASAYKLHCELGPYKFDAEGREEIVHDAYNGWLRAVQDPASTFLTRDHHTVPVNGSGGEHEEHDAVRASPVPPVNPVHPGDQDGRGITSQTAYIFIKDDKSGLISLRHVPRTASPQTDAIILLMYGHLIIDNQRSVDAKLLTKGARQSGVKIADRVSPLLEPYPLLVTRGGHRRATRYALTNPGIAHAKKLLSDLLA
jgi:hypothetical protein